MKKTENPVSWFNGGLAALAVLLLVVAHLPTMGSAPPRFDAYAAAEFLLIVFLPVFCIFYLGRRWRFFERVGWLILIYFVADTLIRV